MDKHTILISEKIKNLNGDALLIFSPENRRYLTQVHTSFGAVLITQGKEKYFLTDFRYGLMAQAQSKDKGFIYIEADKDSILHQLNEILIKHNIQRILVEGDGISLSYFKALSNGLQGELVPCGNIIAPIRSIKTREEIHCIQKSQEIAEKSLKNTLDILRPGMTEKQGAAYLTYQLLLNGSENGNFGIVFASGENSAMPHAVPSERVIQKGDFILIDFGAIYNGYYSDITRTVAIGGASEKMKEVYNIVLDANNRAISAISSDRKCSSIDKIARDIIGNEGYGQYFGHNLGHALGLDIHEDPRLSPVSADILCEGNVVTVEPGIYLPGEFGVRIEDVIYVKDGGYENLTKMDKEFITI